MEKAGISAHTRSLAEANPKASSDDSAGQGRKHQTARLTKKEGGQGSIFVSSSFSSQRHHPPTKKGGGDGEKETPTLAKETQRTREKDKTKGRSGRPFQRRPKRTRVGFHLLALFTLLTSAACLKLPPRLKSPLFGPPRLSAVSEGDAIGSVFVLGDRTGLPSLEVARTEPDRLALGRRTW